jgi:hypothetical protein
MSSRNPFRRGPLNTTEASVAPRQVLHVHRERRPSFKAPSLLSPVPNPNRPVRNQFITHGAHFLILYHPWGTTRVEHPQSWRCRATCVTRRAYRTWHCRFTTAKCPESCRRLPGLPCPPQRSPLGGNVWRTDGSCEVRCANTLRSDLERSVVTFPYLATPKLPPLPPSPSPTHLLPVGLLETCERTES